jgi:hypothetical protein
MADCKNVENQSKSYLTNKTLYKPILLCDVKVSMLAAMNKEQHLLLIKVYIHIKRPLSRESLMGLNNQKFSTINAK